MSIPKHKKQRQFQKYHDHFRKERDRERKKKRKERKARQERNSKKKKKKKNANPKPSTGEAPLDKLLADFDKKHGNTKEEEDKGTEGDVDDYEDDDDGSPSESENQPFTKDSDDDGYAHSITSASQSENDDVTMADVTVASTHRGDKPTPSPPPIHPPTSTKSNSKSKSKSKSSKSKSKSKGKRKAKKSKSKRKKTKGEESSDYHPDTDDDSHGDDSKGVTSSDDMKELNLGEVRRSLRIAQKTSLRQALEESLKPTQTNTQYGPYDHLILEADVGVSDSSEGGESIQNEKLLVPTTAESLFLWKTRSDWAKNDPYLEVSDKAVWGISSLPYLEVRKGPPNTLIQH